MADANRIVERLAKSNPLAPRLIHNGGYYCKHCYVVVGDFDIHTVDKHSTACLWRQAREVWTALQSAEQPPTLP